MKKTRLDIYKKHFRCQYDGETILKAGENAFFPSDPHEAPLRSAGDVKTNRFQCHMLLEQMGIRPEMTIAEITSLIRRGLNKAIADPEYTTGQGELVTLLHSVVDFCEEPIVDQ